VAGMAERGDFFVCGEHTAPSSVNGDVETRAIFISRVLLSYCILDPLVRLLQVSTPRGLAGA
jgi:hypothetical protein